MSMRLTDICKAIAAELRTLDLPTAYPSPPAGQINPPLLVVFSGEGYRERSMGEQYFFHTPRVRIYATTTNIPTALASIDDKLETIADHFDPDVGNDDAFHLRNFAPGKSVDGCELLNWSLSQQIDAGGNAFLGGDLFFRVKVRRQAGDA